jgi:hypothetical protein
VINRKDYSNSLRTGVIGVDCSFPKLVWCLPVIIASFACGKDGDNGSKVEDRRSRGYLDSPVLILSH